MAIPEGGFSTAPVVSPLLAPDNSARLSLLEDFERGGVALNDPTQGMDVRDWRAWSDGAGIWVGAGLGATSGTLFYEGEGITEVSLAFDQNMRPTLAFVEAGACKLRWFDTVANAIAVTTFAGASSPMLTLDDKRDIANATSDIILAYIREDQVRYRQQRDRFGVEYTLGPTPSAGSRIVQLGMGSNYRLQAKILGTPPARYWTGATDKLFVVRGTDLVQLDGGDVATAIWRSRLFEADEVPVMSWARVEGNYPVTLRIRADGDLRWVSPPITSAAPFRIPAEGWREWAVELESAQRVASVALAQTLEDLL